MNIKNLLLVGAVLLGSLGVYSCNKKEMAAGADLVKKEYSGEDLFRGIFFGEGEIGQKIEIYKGKRIEFFPEYNYNQMVKFMLDLFNQDDELRTKFVNNIQSGNLNLVNNELDFWEKRIQAAVTEDMVKQLSQKMEQLLVIIHDGSSHYLVWSSKDGFENIRNFTNFQRELLIKEITNICKK